MKINWMRILKPNVWLLETELEYVKSLLAQSQLRLDQANELIYKSKVVTETIRTANPPAPKIVSGWDSFRQANKYKQEPETNQPENTEVS